MSRSRLKIAVLSLGVVLGYGSAAFHYLRGPHHQGNCLNDWQVVNRPHSE